MDNELTVIDIPKPELTLDELKDRQNKIRGLIKEVMKKDIHYGKVKGVKENFLWKAGADYLLAMFLISVNVRTVQRERTDDLVEYIVTLEGVNKDGIVIGTGVGSCSSGEGKYKWKKCYSNDYNDAPESHRRIKKYGKEEAFQIRTDPADVDNTILKMAKKRAYIDLALTTTGTSDMFKQDEDYNDYQIKPEPKPVPEPPNFWQLVAERSEVEGITEKEVRTILGNHGVKTDAQLKNLTSDKAVEIIKAAI